MTRAILVRVGVSHATLAERHFANRRRDWSEYSPAGVLDLRQFRSGNGACAGYRHGHIRWHVSQEVFRLNIIDIIPSIIRAIHDILVGVGIFTAAIHHFINRRVCDQVDCRAADGYDWFRRLADRGLAGHVLRAVRRCGERVRNHRIDILPWIGFALAVRVGVVVGHRARSVCHSHDRFSILYARVGSAAGVGQGWHHMSVGILHAWNLTSAIRFRRQVRNTDRVGVGPDEL